MKHLLISSLLIFFSQTLHAEDVHKLTVTGNSIVYKPADKLTMTIGVETFDKDVKTATQMNANRIQSVMKSLLQSGLSDIEIQTKDYTISPQSTPSPQNPPPDWQPKIAGYEVRNSLEIRTTKLELAGAIIDAAGRAGANFIHNISFSLQNEQDAKAEAIGLAIQQADFYAQGAATHAKVHLADLIDLNISQPFLNVPYMKAVSFSNAQDSNTPISPREVEVSATVTAIYRIDSDQK